MPVYCYALPFILRGRIWWPHDQQRRQKLPLETVADGDEEPVVHVDQMGERQRRKAEIVTDGMS